MRCSIYKTRQMSAEILTKVRNLLVDPFSWNGLKQQLTLVDTHFARLAHTRERQKRETDNNYTIPISRSTLSRPFAILIVSHFSPICFVLFSSFSLSLSLSLFLSLLFHSRKNPDASDGTIDRKQRALLTIEMIIFAPMMPSLWHHSHEWISYSMRWLSLWKLTFCRKTMSNNIYNYNKRLWSAANTSILLTRIALLRNHFL